MQKPAFLSDKSLTAVQKGTAFHKFLQYCSFEKAKENPEAEKERRAKAKAAAYKRSGGKRGRPKGSKNKVKARGKKRAGR